MNLLELYAFLYYRMFYCWHFIYFWNPVGVLQWKRVPPFVLAVSLTVVFVRHRENCSTWVSHSTCILGLLVRKHYLFLSVLINVFQLSMEIFPSVLTLLLPYKLRPIKFSTSHKTVCTFSNSYRVIDVSCLEELSGVSREHWIESLIMPDSRVKGARLRSEGGDSRWLHESLDWDYWAISLIERLIRTVKRDGLGS